MDNKDLRLAVLIDSENISTKYMKCIFDEISNYGITTYKRAYGDWTSSRLGGWKEIFLKYAITPIQQYSYTQGKNSTDSAMIIDAMDILYSGKVDGFCILSSDSDFTRLAGRLREAGMLVIGMGEKKTVEAFRTACSVFKYLEVLMADGEEDEDDDTLSRQDIEESVRKIITDNNAMERETTVGEIGSKLSNRHADFDVRNYGYSKLSKFLESLNGISISFDGTSVVASLTSGELSRDSVESLVREILDKKKGKMPLPTLKQSIEKKYPDFNIRDYGYSKFARFVNDMTDIKVEDNVVYKEG
ncbi:MAG: NYN domain-containing protein [Lachnospiraceae bacterium]|nr:NYN domain-containing protein [Lachnospiraceae bacterium]